MTQGTLVLNKGMKRFLKIVGLVTIPVLLLVAPAAAHQPVTLSAASATVGNSPILVDGTISFAVYANFSKGQQTRNVRFVLREGERLRAEYLIVDKAPERTLKKSQLPRIAIISPSGRVITMPIRERTPFFEPFGRKNYFYLSRVSMPGEPGVYTVTMRSAVKSSVVLAIGAKEIQGEVLSVGARAGTCPPRQSDETEISTTRAEQMLGMTELAASACAAANGWIFRVIERDGEQFIVTKDYRTNRVNVSINANRVSAITVG